MVTDLHDHKCTERIQSLRQKTISAERYVSIEQAKVITGIYKENEALPVILKRSKSLAQSLLDIPISIDPEELIVGNRTPDIRAGIIFPRPVFHGLQMKLKAFRSGTRILLILKRKILKSSEII